MSDSKEIQQLEEKFKKMVQAIQRMDQLLKQIDKKVERSMHSSRKNAVELTKIKSIIDDRRD